MNNKTFCLDMIFVVNYLHIYFINSLFFALQLTIIEILFQYNEKAKFTVSVVVICKHSNPNNFFLNPDEICFDKSNLSATNLKTVRWSGPTCNINLISQDLYCKCYKIKILK